MNLSVFTAFLLVGFVQVTYGLNCGGGGGSKFLDKISPVNPTSCPTIINRDVEIFCCEHVNSGIGFCCDIFEYLGTVNLILIGVGLLVLIILIVVICRCFCGCLCPCC